MTTYASDDWAVVCRLADLTPERGVAALIDGRQIALFLLHDGSLHAVDHRDPFTGANVLARGIVGTRTIDGRETPTVASPLHKQVFDLTTGRSFDEPQRSVTVHTARVVEGLVEVRLSVAAIAESVPA
jgi:nitrite reductase (NADH) small subunit